MEEDDVPHIHRLIHIKSNIEWDLQSVKFNPLHDIIHRWGKAKSPAKTQRAIAMIQTFIEAGTDINKLNSDRASPLLTAVDINLTVTQELLKLGANPFIVCSKERYERRYPLMLAARKGYCDIFTALREHVVGRKC